MIVISDVVENIVLNLNVNCNTQKCRTCKSKKLCDKYFSTISPDAVKEALRVIIEMEHDSELLK